MAVDCSDCKHEETEVCNECPESYGASCTGPNDPYCWYCANLKYEEARNTLWPYRSFLPTGGWIHPKTEVCFGI